MELFFDVALAWISVALAIILSIVYILRVLNKKKNKSDKTTLLGRLNTKLRKYHKTIGMLLVSSAFIHGILSTRKILSLNWGTAAWIASILLGLNWLVRKKIKFKKGWMYWHRGITIIFIVLIVIHVINVGGSVIFKKVPEIPDNIVDIVEVVDNEDTEDIKDNEDIKDIVEIEEQKYTDGKYTGEAVGFNPGLVVEVEIIKDEIVSIDIIDHNEMNSRYYQPAMEYIPVIIIKTQSTDVDSVTGATYTSIGIKDAVDNALEKAIR